MGTAKPTAKVWMATLVTVSSGIVTTAPTAAAKAPRPAAPINAGGIPTAAPNSGRAPGAKSTTEGRIANSSGPLASTKMRISGFSAARARRGSSLLRVIPAFCALPRRPLAATLLNNRSDWTFSKRFLTLMLFPTLSTSAP